MNDYSSQGIAKINMNKELRRATKPFPNAQTSKIAITWQLNTNEFVIHKDSDIQYQEFNRKQPSQTTRT